MSQFCIIPARTLSDERMRQGSVLWVLIALSQNKDKNGWAFPKRSSLAIKLGCSIKTIDRCIGLLIDWGYIEKHPRTRQDNGQTSNGYHILYDIADPEKDPFEEDNKNVSPGGDNIVAGGRDKNVAGGATPIADQGGATLLDVPPINKEITNNDYQNNNLLPETAEAVVPAEAETSKPKKLNPQVLVDLFHEHCPSLSKVKLLTDSRKQSLRNRWRQAAVDMGRYELPDIEAGLCWWIKFFRLVEKSDFLTGRTGNFRAGFDWMMKQQNFLKVVEGNYKNRSQQ